MHLTYAWTPDSSLSQSNISDPFAKPELTTTYTLYVIDDMDTIEFDEVTVFVDTVPIVQFIGEFTDSTSLNMCFTNLTIPYESNTSFLWVFSDGPDSSTEINPCHEFPIILGVDTFFTVCLTANNACGSYTRCDTLWIDTSGQVVFMLDTGSSEFLISGMKKAGITIETSALIKAYPNPFNEGTRVVFKIAPEAKMAELVIKDLIGADVGRKKLDTGSSYVDLDLNNISKGMYLCSLVVDGQNVGTIRIVKH